MYQDRSSNPVNALQLVDAVMSGMQAGLAGALTQGIDYAAYQRIPLHVCAQEYNVVVRRHNQLVREVRRLDLLLQLRDAELAILRRRMVEK